MKPRSELNGLIVQLDALISATPSTFQDARIIAHLSIIHQHLHTLQQEGRDIDGDVFFGVPGKTRHVVMGAFVTAMLGFMTVREEVVKPVVAKPNDPSRN
jgi:hypothetical protein